MCSSDLDQQRERLERRVKRFTAILDPGRIEARRAQAVHDLLAQARVVFHYQDSLSQPAALPDPA